MRSRERFIIQSWRSFGYASRNNGRMCRSKRFSVTFLLITGSNSRSRFRYRITICGDLVPDVDQTAAGQRELRIFLIVPQAETKSSLDHLATVSALGSFAGSTSITPRTVRRGLRAFRAL